MLILTNLEKPAFSAAKVSHLNSLLVQSPAQAIEVFGWAVQDHLAGFPADGLN